jgi:hypothetical protein
MPIDCESVDYEFMDSNRDSNYELVGYDYIKLNKHLKKTLRLVRNMYNYV